jgi:hypothetical protein
MRVWPAGSESADRPLKTNRAACSPALTGTCWAAPGTKIFFLYLNPCSVALGFEIP